MAATQARAGSTTAEYVVDGDGNRTKVILDIRAYETIMDELEELAALTAVREAEASGEKPVPIAEVLAEVDRDRDENTP